MTSFEGDNDIGPVVAAVIVGTLIVGAVLYGFNRYQQVRTALNLPAIERSVPSIVPAQPQI